MYSCASSSIVYAYTVHTYMVQVTLNNTSLHGDVMHICVHLIWWCFVDWTRLFDLVANILWPSFYYLFIYLFQIYFLRWIGKVKKIFSGYFRSDRIVHISIIQAFSAERNDYNIIYKFSLYQADASWLCYIYYYDTTTFNFIYKGLIANQLLCSVWVSDINWCHPCMTWM